MIMLCKHCFDILGYDNQYTNRVINEDCECCKKGLSKNDVILADDVMVELILMLNVKLGIKTYYSCSGHLNPAKTYSSAKKYNKDLPVFSDTYIVLEDSVEVMGIINNESMFILENFYIKKHGKDKIKLIYRIPFCSTILEHSKAIIEFNKTFINYLSTFIKVVEGNFDNGTI